MHIVERKKMISLENVDSFYLDEESRQRMLEIIQNSEFTVQKVAQSTNGKVSYGYLKNVVYGQAKSIKKDKFIAICESLGVTVEDIFGCILIRTN